MDDRLKRALEVSTNSALLQSQVAIIQHKADTGYRLGYNGGIFVCTPELISFVELMNRRQSEYVVVDKDGTPVKITNGVEFLDLLLDRYGQVTNKLYKDFQEIAKLRNLKDVISGIIDE